MIHEPVIICYLNTWIICMLWTLWSSIQLMQLIVALYLWSKSTGTNTQKFYDQIMGSSAHDSSNSDTRFYRILFLLYCAECGISTTFCRNFHAECYTNCTLFEFRIPRNFMAPIHIRCFSNKTEAKNSTYKCDNRQCIKYKNGRANFYSKLVCKMWKYQHAKTSKFTLTRAHVVTLIP